jgi:multiple antibiotic resistance protein
MSMNPEPLPVASIFGAFLLAFPALFSIVNPIGSALIFKGATADRTEAERHVLARRISIYAAAILLGSIWIGGFILAFFGISLGALRVAGGLVVSVSAWGLLTEPGQDENRKAQDTESSGRRDDDIAFFPLTMPLTTGPGTIAVAVALASQRPANGVGTLPFFAGVSAAAICIAVLIRLSYGWSDRVVGLLGDQGARIVSRLVAFLLLCVGVQIISTGLESLALSILHKSSQ